MISFLLLSLFLSRNWPRGNSIIINVRAEWENGGGEIATQSKHMAPNGIFWIYALIHRLFTDFNYKTVEFHREFLQGTTVHTELIKTTYVLNVITFPLIFRIQLDSSGSITISPVRKEDAGRYQCVARNLAATRETRPVRLRVLGTFASTLLQKRAIGKDNETSFSAIFVFLLYHPFPRRMRSFPQPNISPRITWLYLSLSHFPIHTS